jgi:Eukaryotic-type carbonic anhydrase
MEAHFVHFKAEYGDLETALTKQDGLAIVAILFVVISILH